VVTADPAITEVVAHEFGHTFGLNDCDYPGCPIYSSVMEALVPQSDPNSTVGASGPTTCDIGEVGVAAPDYYCPSSPPPPPPPCYVVETCTDGQAWNSVDCACEPATPIIIDVSGNGFALTNAANGVSFDIAGNGKPIQMGWTAAGVQNAFLCLPDSSGACDNGKHLFGNFTPQPRSSTPNGFAALSVYDNPASGGNGDGIIDSRDAIFSQLRLWVDVNHDGVSQPNEIFTLPALGVTSISLHYQEDRRTDQYGNVFRYRAQVNPNEPVGTGRMAYDVFFVSTATTASNSIGKTVTAARVCPPAPRLLPEKDGRLR